MTRWDKYLIVTLIIVSILGIYYVNNVVQKNDAKYILITVNGKEYKKISIGQDVIGKTYEIKTKFGYNKIEIGDNRVKIIESSCPDKLCVKKGWITKPGEIIVCLPHRMVVEIITENELNDEIDSISY